MRLSDACRQLLAAAALAFGCPDAPTVTARDAHVASGPGRAPAIAFEALAPGDEVAVHFRSDGCFHHEEADVVVTRLERGLAARVVRSSGNIAPGWHVVPYVEVGPKEMRGLDRTLAFYRSERGDGCTTVEQVTLRVLTGPHRGRFEFYRDGSCAGFEREDLYPIGGLVRLARDSSGSGAI